jgi:hypothetical protein
MVLVLILGGGCGHDARRPTAPASGIVTYRGKPLDHGRVVFVHESGEGAASDIAADGRYTLNATVGRNAVMVQCPDPNPKSSAPERGIGMFPPSLIPERYGDHMRSGLTCDVRDGKNTADFDLKP